MNNKRKPPHRLRSAWERAILDALDDGKFANIGDIIERIGIPSDREAAYRALEHLVTERRVEKRQPVLGGQGWEWRLRRRIWRKKRRQRPM